MFNELIHKFTHFSSRFTYRQRFFFWCFLYFFLVPTPAYWILQTQDCYAGRAALQLKGSQEAKSWLRLLDAVLVYYVEWVHAVATGQEKGVKLDVLKRIIDEKLVDVREAAVKADVEVIPRDSLLFPGYLVKNYQDDVIFLERLWDELLKISSTTELDKLTRLFNIALAKLTNRIHQISFDYHLVLQTDAVFQQLSQVLYFSLVRDQVAMAKLCVALEKIVWAPDHDLEKIAFLRQQTIVMEHDFQRTIQAIEKIYQATEKMPFWDTLNYTGSYAKLSECSQHSLNLIDDVQNNLMPFNPDVGEWKQSSIQFIKNIDCIAGIREKANKLFQALLNNEYHFYEIQKVFVVTYLLGIAFLLIIFLAFRFLTRHFIQMVAFIEGLSQGKLLPIATPDPQEEMGQIAEALTMMGTSIRQIVEEIRGLDEGVAEASATIEKTARSQTEAVVLQEKFLEALEINIRKIADKSRQLAETTGQFSKMSAENMQDDRGQFELNHMQAKMEVLKDASSNILDVLDVVQNREKSTRSVTAAMTKISEQASLLALNAAIEVLSVGVHAGNFGDTTEKIHAFSEKTAQATRSIQKISLDMGECVSIGRTTTESCIREITQGANKLIEVGGKLNTIAVQENVQDEKFRLVHKMMNDQANVSENIISSVLALNNLSTENNVSVRQLYQTVLELGMATQEMRSVVNALFVKREGNGHE